MIMEVPQTISWLPRRNPAPDSRRDLIRHSPPGSSLLTSDRDSRWFAYGTPSNSPSQFSQIGVIRGQIVQEIHREQRSSPRRLRIKGNALVGRVAHHAKRDVTNAICM